MRIIRLWNTTIQLLSYYYLVFLLSQNVPLKVWKSVVQIKNNLQKHTQLTMYICRPFQYDCALRWPYEIVLVALRSVVVSLRCVLVTMKRFWFRSGLSTRTVIWWMKQRKNGKSSQICCFKLLKDGNFLCEALVQNCSDLSHIFAESRINRILFRNRTVKTLHPCQT